MNSLWQSGDLLDIPGGTCGTDGLADLRVKHK